MIADEEAALLVRSALHRLEHLTTDEFANGGDRPARIDLARALHHLGDIDDEREREYLTVSQDAYRMAWSTAYWAARDVGHSRSASTDHADAATNNMLERLADG